MFASHAYAAKCASYPDKSLGELEADCKTFCEGTQATQDGFWFAGCYNGCGLYHALSDLGGGIRKSLLKTNHWGTNKKDVQKSCEQREGKSSACMKSLEMMIGLCGRD